jgi:hypothetical protein
VQLAALALALVGYWLPWLTHPVAALRLNGYELSEWVTFLPGVRDGSLPLSRLVFLLPLGCLALLLAVAASWGPHPAPRLVSTQPMPRVAPPRAGLAGVLPIRGWVGWLMLLLSLICLFTVFPPYPYLLTAYADPEYRSQLFVASLGVVLLLLALYVPNDLKATLQIALALLGGGLGLWSLLVLRPVAAGLLASPWPIGLGWPIMLSGFALLAWGGLRELFGPRV